MSGLSGCVHGKTRLPSAPVVVPLLSRILTCLLLLFESQVGASSEGGQGDTDGGVPQGDRRAAERRGGTGQQATAGRAAGRGRAEQGRAGTAVRGTVAATTGTAGGEETSGLACGCWDIQTVRACNRPRPHFFPCTRLTLPPFCPRLLAAAPAKTRTREQPGRAARGQARPPRPDPCGPAWAPPTRGGGPQGTTRPG